MKISFSSQIITFIFQWEKEKPRRRKRDGPPKKHRESEFKHHVPREEGRGPAPNPYIQTESGDTGNGPRRGDTRRQNSREGRGRAKHRSSEGQARVGETDVGKESYRRPNFNAEPGKPNQGHRDREDRSASERRRGRSPETDRPDREDPSRGRGGRRGGYKPRSSTSETWRSRTPASPLRVQPRRSRVWREGQAGGEEETGTTLTTNRRRSGKSNTAEESGTQSRGLGTQTGTQIGTQIGRDLVDGGDEVEAGTGGLLDIGTMSELAFLSFNCLTRNFCNL